MADEFQTVEGVTAPAKNIKVITPNDSTDLTDVTKALYIGSAGAVAVIAADDTVAVTIPGVQAGSILPIRVKRVMATNTTVTAGNIIALY